MSSEPNEPWASVPPEAWGRAHRAAQRIASPIARFVHIEAASGIVLLLAAIVAFAWANSPFWESYVHLWHTELGFQFGEYAFKKDLHFWINDGLMTIFFLVVGVEIKRELVEGELASLQRAALPVAAAVGGMVVPAAIYLAFNLGGPGVDGFGVPIATDIAFAVGILTLLGKRVPASLRVMLLAVAIIDDIGAILVIAIAYTADFSWLGVGVAGGGIAAVYVMQSIGIRPVLAYSIPLLVMWGGMLEAGVHPTIAGVICGLLTPVRPWFSLERFRQTASAAVMEFATKHSAGEHDPQALVDPIRKMQEAGTEAVAPTTRVQYMFHTTVAYGIMPLFALANAGVRLDGLDFSFAGANAVLIGTILGLAVGKPLGIVGFSAVLIRLGLVQAPKGVDLRGLLLIGAVAGIGFTMAIFIAELAFPGSELLPIAKLSVLIGTAIATATGVLVGLVFMPAQPPDDASAVTLQEAESRSDL